MNAIRLSRLKQVNAWWRAQGNRYVCLGTSNYGSAESAARRRGFPHRTTEGMYYHIPGLNRKPADEARWPNKTIYLLYYGEELEDVQLAAAQFVMVHPNLTHRVLLSCKGERP